MTSPATSKCSRCGSRERSCGSHDHPAAVCADCGTSFTPPEELKARREALNLSQADLAGALGVHKRTVAAWEQGRQRIPEYLALALETLERKAKKK